MEHQSSSYELQVSYYTEYIQKNPNWEFVKVYTDEGITGTSTKNRTGFLEMIEDCKAGKIDYIITKSISRFARNTLDCLHYVRLLKSQNIGIYFEKENIDSLDGASELFLTILSSMAQEESKSLSLNSTWGVMKRFSQGKAHIPTVYFLGYDQDEAGNLVINEEQAKIIRRMYDEYLEGKGSQLIAKGLMRDGILTARGNPTWTADSVRKILINEKHKGDAVCQKTVTVDYLTHKRVPNINQKPKYYIKNNHPGIVSEEIWNRVQEEMRRRSDMKRNPEQKYKMNYSGRSAFSNKLFCGNCGRPATRRRLTSKLDGEKCLFTAWQCRIACKKTKEDVECNSKYIWETALEKAFMRVINEINCNREKLMKEVGEVLEDHALSESEEARLQELEQKMENISDRISEMASRESVTKNPVYDATLRNLIYEQEIIRQEYESISSFKKEGEFIKGQLKEMLIQLDTLNEDSEFRDDIFNKTIEQCILQDDHIVEFRFNCGAIRNAGARHIRCT